jgi:CRISPR-associated protein Cmr6
MSRANIGWLFYKEMYKKGNDDNHIQKTMNRLLEVNGHDESMSAKQSFTLDTIYPGLLIGSGYTHGLSSDYDAKIGFYFDHTTGLPLIQGSSVKGMLRSCFGLAVKGQNDKYENEKHELINSLLKEKVDVKALANEIFEGLDQEGKPMSIYSRDIFYEARVVRVKKELLSDDYITPHGEDPFKNPTPIRFIKVAPEVTFEFNFDLKDSKTLGVSADEKEMLFLGLLQEFGIGAKTNVGYGQFKVYTEEEMTQLKKRKNKEAIDAKISSVDSSFEKLKLELDKEQKADTLYKKIKKDIELLDDEEKDELFELLATYIKKDKSLDIDITKDWLSNTSKKEAEQSVGKWHFKTLKLC